MSNERPRASGDELAILQRCEPAEIARLADVCYKTAERARAGLPVRAVSLRAVLAAAAWITGRDKAKADALCPPQSDAPKAGCCVQCLRQVRKLFRRLLCRTCHRKLTDAGLQLPPPCKRGKRARDHLAKVRAWFRALPRDQQAVIRAIAKERAA